MPSLSQKFYWWAVAGFVALELLSWNAYSSHVMTFVFWLAVLAIAVITWFRPTWLALASLAELVVGSKGYLLFGTVHGQEVSLRMVLFVGLVLSVLRLWPKLKFDFPKSITKPLLLLLLWVVVMVGWGVIRGNGLKAV